MSTKKKKKGAPGGIPNAASCEWCGKAGKDAVLVRVLVRRLADDRVERVTLCQSCRERPTRTVWLGHRPVRPEDGPPDLGHVLERGRDLAREHTLAMLASWRES